ncbi:hypothetical protein FAZ69_31985 [Trinickia terrae]|uniref:Uncharacterized protein n=1 Tax=Trinickia terrae TaxID=2571161 RepID=A0A4U1HBM7_9BURK|nr:hypothetical protein [Trinickia terrae]TKC78209.1 hypothetical protein FAZ69_31985 [Trinickia terrae]
MFKIIVLVSAVVFLFAGNFFYNFALLNVVGGSGISLVAMNVRGVFYHRLQMIGASSFLGFSVGLGVLACRQFLNSPAARRGAVAALVILTVASLMTSFLFVKKETRLAVEAVGSMGGTSLPLESIPLYQVGLLPGLCVLGYAAIVFILCLKRKDA